MKKLIFNYSAMNAGKSMHLIMTYYNYVELGLKPIAVVPSNSKSKKVKSRVGTEVEAIHINNLNEVLLNEKIDCILVDEAQFLTKKEVLSLSNITIDYEIPVICYGLRTTAFGELFEGSKYLLAIADELVELPTLCFCGKKARMNLRVIDGKVDTSNEVVKLRSEQKVSYISVCRSCFYKYINSKSDMREIVEKFDNTKNTKGEDDEE